MNNSAEYMETIGGKSMTKFWAEVREFIETSIMRFPLKSGGVLRWDFQETEG